MLLSLAACAHNTPQSAADDVTHAIYANNVSGVTSELESSLASKITRASVAVISDKMHALGAYNGLTELATDPGKHEYTYRANFTKGSMNFVVRTDANGKLAAYRVFPT